MNTAGQTVVIEGGKRQPCSRCAAERHGNAETMPHLCADKERRLKREARLLALAEDALRPYVPEAAREAAAAAVYKALNGQLG